MRRGCLELYGMSEEGRHHIVSRLPELDPDVWGRAPKQAMAEMLNFLKKEHGGVESYLTSIGFGPELQAKLRKTLGTEAPNKR